MVWTERFPSRKTDILILDSRLDGLEQIKTSVDLATEQGVKYGSIAVAAQVKLKIFF